MSKYTIDELAAACGGELHISNENRTVRYLLTDSRKFSFPGESLFIALRGERHDGHNYLKDLFRQEVRNFLVDKIPEDREIRNGANFIVADDTLLALQRIAKMHRDRFDIPVIGITGSNGKTILKEWLYQLLNIDKAIARSPKSYNSQVGVPLSVWQLKSHHDLAVFEAGISMPGEMGFLEPVISPTIGVITNIGQAHQEHFTGMEHKLSEKLKLFEKCDTLIYCADHELIDTHISNSQLYRGKKLFRWGRSDRSDLKITKVEQMGVTTEITGEFEGVGCSVTIPFTDRASVENGVHAWAVLICLGYSCEFISSGMKNLLPVEMRLEQKQGINNCTIINDSYNSDPGSLEIAMDLLSQVAGTGRKTIILSDMFGTGMNEGDLYNEIGTLLGREKLWKFIGIGRNIRQVESYIRGRCEFYDLTGEFIRNYNPANYENETILLKGARKFGFERISLLLEEKVHATVLEINLDNLVHNYNYFKSKLNPGTRIMAVVKAYSYGSGSYQIAATLSHNLVDYLAVAFVDEGVSLRKSGIKVPVMVMNPDASAFLTMTDYMLEPEIYSFRGLELFEEHLRNSGLTSYPVHIKLDTGMNRLGFSSDDTGRLLRLLCNSEQVRVRSLFSHLAAADEPGHDAFTLAQIEMFRETSAMITRSLGYQVLRHILNSAGIERFPEAQFDMVRLGIGLYGVSSVKDLRLACVNTFKSVISQIRVVPSGQTVGYSRSHRVTGDTRIAVVPVGYADGLDRRLGNMNGLMLVNGVRVPVVGNICMDMCMLDLTGTNAKEGDEVIIFGEDYSIADIADKLATIPYEIFTNISGRVKRVYVRE
jgi:Alr-MurF fusion protein